MACMEHVCRVPGCSWTAMDNNPRTSCPKHPGETLHHFDEPDYDDSDMIPDEDDDDE